MLLACDVRLCLALPRRDYCLPRSHSASRALCLARRNEWTDLIRALRGRPPQSKIQGARTNVAAGTRDASRGSDGGALPAHTCSAHTRTLCWQSCLAAGALDLVDHSGTTLAGTTLEGAILIGALLDHASFAGTSLAGTSIVGTSIVGTSNRLAARPCTPGALAPWGPCSVLSTSAAPSTRARCSATPNNECMLSCASPRVACVQKRAVV